VAREDAATLRPPGFGRRTHAERDGDRHPAGSRDAARADACPRETLARYAGFSPPLRSRAVALLCSRSSWSRQLVETASAGKIDAGDVPVDRIRQMLAHNDPQLVQAIEARWGKIRPATPGEKQAYVPVMGRILKWRLICMAACPKSWSAGLSCATTQASSLP